MAPAGGVRADLARRARRRGLGYRITGARCVAPRDRRQASRDGVLVRQGATALAFSPATRHREAGQNAVIILSPRRGDVATARKVCYQHSSTSCEMLYLQLFVGRSRRSMACPIPQLIEDRMSDMSNNPVRPLIGFSTRDNAPQITPAPVSRAWMSEMSETRNG